MRMEIDSKPEEIDELDRRIMQLQIEREALKKETDPASKDRLERLRKELAELEQRSAELTAQWQAEKEQARRRRPSSRSSSSRPRSELETAAAARRLRAAPASSPTASIPELEKQLAEAEAGRRSAWSHEAVTPSRTSPQVVARWTGIPVDRMLEGEREKLLQHGGRSCARAWSARRRR